MRNAVSQGSGPIVLIGAGKMGSALLQGWMKQALPATKIIVVEADVDQAEKLRTAYGIDVVQSIRTVPLSPLPEAIVLAVKPQQMQTVLQDCKELASHAVMFISIAAGKTTRFFHQHLGANTPVIRAMPNLPAVIGQGATVLYATASVNSAQLTLAGALFEAVGHYSFIDDERLMDAVTALSGSGPAYVFLLVETMVEAGKSLGLTEKMATSLAKDTVLGSALLLAEAQEPASLLRQHVTSPGGTTQAALQVLMREGGMKTLMKTAMEAACKRSEALAE